MSIRMLPTTSSSRQTFAAMTDLRVEDDSKYYREDGGDSRFASCSGQWRASKCVYTTGRVLAGREANAKDETGRRSQGDPDELAVMTRRVWFPPLDQAVPRLRIRCKLIRSDASTINPSSYSPLVLSRCVDDPSLSMDDLCVTPRNRYRAPSNPCLLRFLHDLEILKNGHLVSASSSIVVGQPAGSCCLELCKKLIDLKWACSRHNRCGKMSARASKMFVFILRGR